MKPINIKKRMKEDAAKFDLAWKEFFNNKSKPQNDKEEKMQMEEFANWYNKTHSEKLNFMWDDNYQEPDQMLDEARNFLMQGKYDKAVQKLQEFIDIIPDDEAVLSMMAEAYGGLGDFKEAKKYLKKLHNINPDNSDFYIVQAQWDILKSDFADALKKVNQALRTNPNYFDGLMMKAQLLYWTGDEAYTQYTTAARRIDKKRADNFMKNYWIEEVPKTHPLLILTDKLSLIDLLMAQRNFKDALHELTMLEHLKMDSKNSEMVSGLKIECLFILHHNKEAEKAINDLLLKNPENPHAYLYKSQIFSANDDLRTALSTINEGIRIAEKNHLVHPDYYLFKANILNKLGEDYEEWKEKGEKLRIKNLAKFRNLANNEISPLGASPH